MKLNFNGKQIDLRSFLSKSQNTILSAALILAVSSGANAILGLLKNNLLSRYFGVSDQLTIFFTAEKIPNLTYSILIVGAISTILIPMLASHLKKDKEEALTIASTIMTATFLCFFLMGIVLFIAAPYVIDFLALGTFSKEDIALGASLFRIMLVSQTFLIAGSLISSVLQSFKIFLIPAIAPIAYNVGMIMGIILFSKTYGIFGPATGVLAGSLLHLGLQLPALKYTGFKFKPSLKVDAETKRTFYLIPPRIVSVLLANILDVVNNSFAILISQPSVVVLRFASQLQSFPVNIFGLSIAAASLPTLSTESGIEDTEKFKKTLTTSLMQMMFLTVPLSVMLFVLKLPSVRIVYGAPSFPWWATITTAYTLAYFSISIFFQSANFLLTRGFYALKDTKTPALVHTVTILINVLITLWFVKILKFEVWSIAFSYSITSFFDTLALTHFLSLKLGGLELKKILGSFSKITLAALLMGVTLYIPMKLLDNYILNTQYVFDLLLLTIVAGACGTATYLLFTHLLKVEEIELFYKILRKLRFTPQAAVQLAEPDKKIEV
jgi:putative peptidoglycan lipid II flippase